MEFLNFFRDMSSQDVASSGLLSAISGGSVVGRESVPRGRGVLSAPVVSGESSVSVPRVDSRSARMRALRERIDRYLAGEPEGGAVE